MAAAVNVPLTADVESGYGDPAGAAREVIAAGAVGIDLPRFSLPVLIWKFGFHTTVS
jgi:hypothetical protein